MISVRRHLTKNRPGLPQKSSETLSTSLLVKRERSPRTPLRTREGDPRIPLRKLLMASWRLCCGNWWDTSRIVVVTFLPTVCKQHSCLGLAILTQVLVVTFGLWVSLRHSIFTTGSLSFWLAVASQETTALSVLFSFQSFLRLFPRDALHRFTGHSGHWPFAGDSEASGCQPMPLRVGTPEWAYSLF